MQDIGYSGQYLEDKEFRIKIRTGTDISKVTGDAVCGEIFFVTGSSPGVYIATETSSIDSYEIYKMQDLTPYME